MDMNTDERRRRFMVGPGYGGDDVVRVHPALAVLGEAREDLELLTGNARFHPVYTNAQCAMIERDLGTARSERPDPSQNGVNTRPKLLCLERITQAVVSAGLQDARN